LNTYCELEREKSCKKRGGGGGREVTGEINRDLGLKIIGENSFMRRIPRKRRTKAPEPGPAFNGETFRAKGFGGGTRGGGSQTRGRVVYVGLVVRETAAVDEKSKEKK